MNKIPKWVWLIVAAGGAYYLYTKYKNAATIALTTGTPTVGTPTLPGTATALSSAGAQIGAGITSLFNQL